jgi:ribose 5-phosphate isomerase A
MTADELKRAAAHAALAFVKPGMRLGLGSGSTANHFIDALAGLAKTKAFDLLCVPTSEATRRRAESLGLPLSTLDETPLLDLTVDGADEVDDSLRLIKGGGGAHLREKIVATSSRRMIVIADHSKKVAALGAFPLPIEIVRFGAVSTLAKVEAAVNSAGCSGSIKLRSSGAKPFITDNDNYICDASLGRIAAPERLATALVTVPGVVEHGLFLDIASLALIATPAGVEMLERSE